VVLGGTVTVDNSTLINNSAQIHNYAEPEILGDGDGGAIYNSAGTVTISNSTLSRNVTDLSGGGICNNVGTVTVENSSSITGNLGADGDFGADVDNLSVLCLDSTSTIGFLYGNSTIPIP